MPTATAPPANTPETSRSIKPSTNASRTLAELRSRIEQIAHQPALEPGFFAVKIVSLDTGSVIYEQDAHKFVRRVKHELYTVATAFDRLTPTITSSLRFTPKKSPKTVKLRATWSFMAAAIRRLPRASITGTTSKALMIWPIE